MLVPKSQRVKYTSYAWLSSVQSWKSQMRFVSHENDLWFYFLVSSLVAWCIFCLMRQNEMYDTQIQNELGFRVRENLQLTNTDKKPLEEVWHPWNGFFQTGVEPRLSSESCWIFVQLKVCGPRLFNRSFIKINECFIVFLSLKIFQFCSVGLTPVGPSEHP